MRPRRTAALVLMAALGSRAAADPITHVESDSTCKTSGGSEVSFPPGYFLDEATWAARDAEYRRLQDAETRLSAENVSLKTSAKISFSTWGLIVLAVAAGAVGGYYIAK